MKKILEAFEKQVDSKDREKIEERTQVYEDDYDYRLHFPVQDNNSITFLAVGDTGGGGKDKRMKEHVADAMYDEPSFDLTLHLGDVVYLSGSKVGYPKRFIKPFRRWLKNGKKSKFDNLIFNKPFLPVYGNHDYYDIPNIPFLGPVARLFSRSIGAGSNNGEVFEQAFINTNTQKVKDKVLPYIPKESTRIPNRYYWFTYGPCAFFALDSNTLDQVKEPNEEMKNVLKQQIKKLKIEIEKNKAFLDGFIRLEEKVALTRKQKDEFEELMDETLDQQKKLSLLIKRSEANINDFDHGQLKWLDQALEKVATEEAEHNEKKWKIVYMHHSMYSSESGHTGDSVTGGIRENLRSIFIKHKVNLVLSGHSHCFEWPMRAPAHNGASEEEQKLAEAEGKICYIVSGGGGKKLRESVLEEDRSSESVKEKQDTFLHVAESKAFTAKLQKGEDGFIDVFNYLRIEATKDSLKVIPKGLMKLSKKKTVKLDPFLTKVFTVSNDEIGINQQALNGIRVYHDKKPEGVWGNE